MIYYYLRTLLKPFFLCYFQRVINTGKHHIPKEGPILFTANHPSSFLDGIVLSLTQPRKVYFLTRADVFKYKIIALLLKSIGLIPIYRAREFGLDVKKNKEVFEAVFKIFDGGGAVLIFPEGTSRLDRSLNAFKKGTARLVMSYAERNSSQRMLSVIPVGINFFSYTDHRAPVLIAYGKAVDYQYLINNGIKNEQEIFQKFNQLLRAQLSNLVILAEGEKQFAKLDRAFEKIQFQKKTQIPTIEKLNQIVITHNDGSLNNSVSSSSILSRIQKCLEYLLFITLTLASIVSELLYRLSKFINRNIPLSKKFHASIIFSLTFTLTFIVFTIIIIIAIICKEYQLLLLLLSLPTWHVKRTFQSKIKG
ncbi:MAG: 1-acyl-sn-glycerol-3-phosphate acyltransferase [Flavobacteriales bacterium]